mmetsp:Transcript_84625/g.244618  ORF Transcript_84625/g.244618 Transcript_84625/m.244618 type:complete len:208 (-) Transcript_84625:20-643(-)
MGLGLQPFVPELPSDRQRVAGGLQGRLDAISPDINPGGQEQSGHLHRSIVHGAEILHGLRQRSERLVHFVSRQVRFRQSDLHAALSALVTRLAEALQVGCGLLHCLVNGALLPVGAADQPKRVLLARQILRLSEELQRLAATRQRLIGFLVLQGLLRHGVQGGGLAHLGFGALGLGQGAIVRGEVVGQFGLEQPLGIVRDPLPLDVV